MVTFLHQGFNYTAILKVLELRGRYGRWFIFDKSSENGIDTIILKHRQGPRVTAFLSEAAKALLERAKLKFEMVEMEHQVLFRVHLNRKTRTSRTITRPRRIRSTLDSDKWTVAFEALS
jgi:hypothetical protein